MIIVIDTTDGNSYKIKNDNLTSVFYSSDCSDSSEIVIGFASASALNFEIIDLQGKFKNIDFTNSILKLFDDSEEFKIGTFKIKKIYKKRNTIKFECTDNMVNFDVRFQGGIFPMTINELLNTICIQCGVENNSKTNLPNLLNVVISNSELIGKNCREILQFICEVTGTYAIINNDGELELKWFNFKTVKKEIEFKELIDFERDENQTNVSGVQIYVENELYKVSDGKYDLYLTENNPLFLNNNTNIKLLLNNIYNSNIKGMSYHGGIIKIRPDYNLNLGDVIKVKDNEGSYLFIVSNISVKNNSSMTITSAGQNFDREFNSSSGAGAGGNQAGNDNVKISKNENYRTIIIAPNTHATANSIKIENVNEKSQVLLSYACSLKSSSESSIYFEIVINNNVSKKFNCICKTTDTISFSYKLDLDNSIDINSLLINIYTTNSQITINKMYSIATITAINCTTDNAGNVNELRLNDSILKIIYPKQNNRSKFFVIKTLNDAYNTILEDSNNDELSEIVDKLDLSKINKELIFEEIKEEIIT